jgi:hypothetical protein
MARKRIKSKVKSKVTSRIRSKVSRKATRPRAAPRTPDALDAFIDAAGRALALPVEPGWRGAIRANLDATLRLAALYADFPLPDDAEPAPVFRA